MNISPNNIKELKQNEIFVFGSNTAGKHGAGAAKQALKFGARYGEGIGRWGRTYAIPTKNTGLKTLPLKIINEYVAYFIDYAKNLPGNTFLVTPIGCGLAGYTAKDIAPMFKNCLYVDNIYLPEIFLKEFKLM